MSSICLKKDLFHLFSDVHESLNDHDGQLYDNDDNKNFHFKPFLKLIF